VVMTARTCTLAILVSLLVIDSGLGKTDKVIAPGVPVAKIYATFCVQVDDRSSVIFRSVSR
jgi:hypothetical protein